MLSNRIKEIIQRIVFEEKLVSIDLNFAELVESLDDEFKEWSISAYCVVNAEKSYKVLFEIRNFSLELYNYQSKYDYIINEKYVRKTFGNYDYQIIIYLDQTINKTIVTEYKIDEVESHLILDQRLSTIFHIYLVLGENDLKLKKNRPPDKIELKEKNIVVKSKNEKIELGLRTKGIYKDNSFDLPLISVIMPTFNSEKYIEQSIQSVLSQRYNNVELIIVDGQSTDTTLNIISRYAEKIDYCISEEDNGIFDAINKGTYLSRGIYSVFLGSDDLLFSDTIEKVVGIIKENDYPEFCYGDMFIHKRSGELRQKRSFWDGKGYNFAVSHPALYIRKDVFETLNGFSISYKFCSDADFELRLFKKFNNNIHIDSNLAIFREGGITYLNPNKRKEAYKIFKEHNVLHFGYYYKMVKAFIMRVLIKYIGEKNFNKLLKFRKMGSNK